MLHTSKNILIWLIFHPFLSDAHQDEVKDRPSSDSESEWGFIAGVAAAVVAGLGLLCWLCLKVQKVQSQNAVDSLTSVPDPDTERAARLVQYETGVTLLTGI